MPRMGLLENLSPISLYQISLRLIFSKCPRAVQWFGAEQFVLLMMLSGLKYLSHPKPRLRESSPLRAFRMFFQIT